jgi:O-methyltransferase involved in polyketide biosynthesis
MVDPALNGVAETLLIPLYNRAMESQRPDAIMKDEKAVALVKQMSYDFDQVRKIRMFEANKVARIMLTREIDRYARDFLSRHPEAVVVHIGCGLDSRFERVDNGKVEWYDLDLPDVIGLRRKFIGDEGERYHLLGCSVLDDAWMETLKVHSQRPFLFLAENVFVYFKEAQVKTLVLRLRDHFPGAELVFDGWTPFFVWLGNRQLSSSKFAGLWKVERRVQEYEGARDEWHSDWFQPTLEQIEIGVISWERLIAAVRERESAAADALGGFYEQCLEFNG